VLHTRPRAEKPLARHCFTRSLSFFLPLYRHQWRKHHRSFTSYLPLFPGYLFLQGDNDMRLHALESTLIAHVLPVADGLQLRSDLQRVQRLIQADMPLTAEQRLQPGSPVAIVHGPLVGLEGTLLRRGKKWHFIVEVQMLQCGVSVELEGWMLRAVDPVGFPT
jgi:transcriptional antiterminator RfaH